MGSWRSRSRTRQCTNMLMTLSKNLRKPRVLSGRVTRKVPEPSRGKASAMYSPRPGFLYAVAVASIAFSVVSCSGETAGLPQADEVAGQSSVQSNSASPRYSIDEPLDVTPFLGSPCQLVSPGVLKKFDYQPEDGDENLPESDEMAAEGGPYCDWQGGDEGTLSVAIDSGNTERGLGGLENMRTQIGRAHV